MDKREPKPLCEFGAEHGAILCFKAMEGRLFVGFEDGTSWTVDPNTGQKTLVAHPTRWSEPQ